MHNYILEDLIIEGKKDTFFIPSIHFNGESGICSIEGESYLEDSIRFYKKLYDWLNNFIIHVSKKIIFNVKLTYFNTSSEKGIFDLLMLLKKYKEDGGQVERNWVHSKDE